jgi:hypothetical protein
MVTRRTEATRLETILQEAVEAFDHARVELDEREQGAFLDIILVRLAREQAARLERERRAA